MKAEKTHCTGKEERQADVLSVGACAMYCRKISPVFVFGRPGTEGCLDNGKCKCICETAANDKGCSEKNHERFDLYEFNVNADAPLQTPNKATSKLFLLYINVKPKSSFLVALILYCHMSFKSVFLLNLIKSFYFSFHHA